MRLNSGEGDFLRNFFSVDLERFPCLADIYFRKNGVLSVRNEVGIEVFVDYLDFLGCPSNMVAGDSVRSCGMSIRNLFALQVVPDRLVSGKTFIGIGVVQYLEDHDRPICQLGSIKGAKYQGDLSIRSIRLEGDLRCDILSVDRQRFLCVFQHQDSLDRVGFRIILVDPEVFISDCISQCHLLIRKSNMIFRDAISRISVNLREDYCLIRIVKFMLYKHGDSVLLYILENDGRLA